jgi:hypothetical protein
MFVGILKWKVGLTVCAGSSQKGKKKERKKEDLSENIVV